MERAAGGSVPAAPHSGAKQSRQEGVPSSVPPWRQLFPQFLLGARHHASSSPNVKCLHLLSGSAGSLGSRFAHQGAEGPRARGLPSSPSQWGQSWDFRLVCCGGGSMSTSVWAVVGSMLY